MTPLAGTANLGEGSNDWSDRRHRQQHGGSRHLREPHAGPGETLEAPTFEMGHGGKGANQAVAAAKLGAEVMMLTRVGDDAFADTTISNLKACGIDTTHVAKVPGRSSGVAPIMVDPSGENSILIVKGANNDLLPPDIEAAAEDLKRAT